MGKAADRERKRQRKAREKVLRLRPTIEPVDPKSLYTGQSCWITGWFWEHDMKVVEPFCAVWQFGQWTITNLDRGDMDYYEAMKLLREPKRLLLFEDRVAAIYIADALDGQRLLLESYAEYMSDKDFVQYMRERAYNS